MTTNTNTRLGAALLLGLAGCVGPVEIAPLPYAHPANPDAPAGKTSDAGSGLAPGADSGPVDKSMDGMAMPRDMAGMSMTAGGHAGMKEMKADAATGKYQCPMHAEFRSDKPGKCPICGMRLVNKGDATKPHEDHEQ